MKLLRTCFIRFLFLLTALALLLFLLQGPVAHRTAPFVPAYPMEDLRPVLSELPLEPSDYDLLYLQTGLARPAVDALLNRGAKGIAHIFNIQRAFFAPAEVVCAPLIGPLVKEDHLTSEGKQAFAPPFGDLQPGDILLTYSTHTLGWRHGHAGLVLDTENGGHSLEAVMVGTDSAVMDLQHWRGYSNYIVLRLKEMTPALSEALTKYALSYLNGVPYRLTSGLTGHKEPGDKHFGVQCSYLVWYAFQRFGYDLDSDGGALVTVNDLAHSPLLDIVQVYGLNPIQWTNHGRNPKRYSLEDHS